MLYLSRSILLLICLTVLFACDSAQMQEKQIKETQSEKTSQPNNLFVVMVNKKYGFIDRTGKIVIEPQFEFANDFVEGLSLVGIRNDELKSGYIDETGKIVISLQSGGSDYSEGLAAVGAGEFTMHGSGDHKFGFVDKTGKLIIQLPFYSIVGNFYEGLAIVEHKDKYGFIDKRGKIVIKPEYTYVEDFRNGLARIQVGK